MEDKFELPIGNMKIIAFVNDWKDGMPKEVFISIKGSDDVYMQDICMVREHYHYNPQSGNFETSSDMVDCKVWSNSDTEDYTHEFTIVIKKEEE